MPNFSFAAPKLKTTRKNVAKSSRVEVKAKGVKGVVFISADATYYVIVDGCKYNILSDCYSCKNKCRIYFQISYDNLHMICYIRDKDKAIEQNTNYWLPFAPACVVIGDIVIDKFTKLSKFRISKCYSDYDDPDTNYARDYYRQHIAEINKAIKEKQINE